MKIIFFVPFFLCACTITFAQKTLVLQPDPTEGKDANIIDYSPDANIGSVTYIHIAKWTHNGDPSRERALIAFDLSSIASDATILSATLFLYADAFTPGVPAHTLVTTNAFLVQKITSHWDEQTVSWNTKPNVTSLHEITLPPTNITTQNYEIDVKSLIEDMITDPSHSFGFMFSLLDEVTLYNCINFFSSESPFPSTRPKLEITYLETPVVNPPKPPTLAAVKVYELITPNQDGKNDFLFIEGLEDYASYDISIYNQWGNVVFHSENYANDWNGSNLVGGMYYYIVKINNTTLSGELYLDK